LFRLPLIRCFACGQRSVPRPTEIAPDAKVACSDGIWGVSCGCKPRRGAVVPGAENPDFPKLGLASSRGRRGIFRRRPGGRCSLPKAPWPTAARRRKRSRDRQSGGRGHLWHFDALGCRFESLPYHSTLSKGALGDDRWARLAVRVGWPGPMPQLASGATPNLPENLSKRFVGDALGGVI
jgi:hypothetical protein